jgi:hypothetical protein
MMNKIQSLENAMKRSCVLLKDCQDRKAQQAFDLLFAALEVPSIRPAPTQPIDDDVPEEETYQAHFVGQKIRRRK